MPDHKMPPALQSGGEATKQKTNVKEFRLSPHGVEAHKKSKETILQMREAGNKFIQNMNTYLAEKHLAAHKKRASAMLEENICLVLNQRRRVGADIPSDGVMRIHWDDNASRHDVMRDGFSTAQKAIILGLLAAPRARVAARCSKKTDAERGG